MYTYKQIGSSAAAVLTVLATAGGLLWWLRGPTGYPVPHPQDEAELMTACLERSAAIGRPDQFITTIPANVSQIVTGQAASATIFNLNGNLFDGTNRYVRYQTRYCGWSPTQQLVLAGIGGGVVGHVLVLRPL